MFRLLLLAALVAVFVALLARYPLGTSERCARPHADLARREMGNLRIELDPEPNPEPNPEPAVLRPTFHPPPPPPNGCLARQYGHVRRLRIPGPVLPSRSFGLRHPGLGTEHPSPRWRHSRIGGRGAPPELRPGGLPPISRGATMPRWAWLEANPKKAARLTERIVEGLREVGLLLIAFSPLDAAITKGPCTTPRSSWSASSGAGRRS